VGAAECDHFETKKWWLKKPTDNNKYFNLKHILSYAFPIDWILTLSVITLSNPQCIYVVMLIPSTTSEVKSIQSCVITRSLGCFCFAPDLAKVGTWGAHLGYTPGAKPLTRTLKPWVRCGTVQLQTVCCCVIPSL